MEKKFNTMVRRAGLKNRYQQTPIMVWSPICAKDVAEALRTTLNSKAPGRDQIPNFWLKQLTATHRHIAAIFNKLIEEDQIPEWLNFLIPTNENTENPKNYRPVTCLPTMYKLISSVISRNMQKYVDDENLIQKEQKGCYRGSKGCKDQLLISKAIPQECKCRNKNLSMAWIDYQKVFDRVPHSWIIKSLELIGINNKAILFTKKENTHVLTCRK